MPKLAPHCTLSYAGSVAMHCVWRSVFCLSATIATSRRRRTCSCRPSPSPWRPSIDKPTNTTHKHWCRQVDAGSCDARWVSLAVYVCVCVRACSWFVCLFTPPVPSACTLALSSRRRSNTFDVSATIWRAHAQKCAEAPISTNARPHSFSYAPPRSKHRSVRCFVCRTLFFSSTCFPLLARPSIRSHARLVAGSRFSSSERESHAREFANFTCCQKQSKKKT